MQLSLLSLSIGNKWNSEQITIWEQEGGEALFIANGYHEGQ